MVWGGNKFYLVVASNFQPVQVFKQVSSSMQKKSVWAQQKCFRHIIEFQEKMDPPKKKTKKIWGGGRVY